MTTSVDGTLGLITTGNVTANNIFGNIDGNSISGDISTTGNVTSAGNVSGFNVAAANQVYVGPLQLRAMNPTTFGVFQSDGVTQANIDVGTIDVSAITQGNSVIGIDGVDGNAYITVDGANVFEFNTRGISITGTEDMELVSRRSLGTAASPTPVLQGDNLLTLRGEGYTSFGNYQVGGGVNIVANGGALPNGTANLNSIVKIYSTDSSGINYTITLDDNGNLALPGRVSSRVYSNIVDTGSYLASRARGTDVGNILPIQATDSIMLMSAYGYTGNGTITVDGITGWAYSGAIEVEAAGLPGASGNNIPSNVYIRSVSAANVINELNFDTQGNLDISGNTIYLGPNSIQLKAIDANTFGVFKADGVTQANIDIGNIDSSQITQGNSIIAFTGVGGNAYVQISAANVAEFTPEGLDVTGNITVTGIISAGNLAAPGTSTDVLFNEGGIIGASSALQFNYSSNALSIGGNLTVSGDATFLGNAVVSGNIQQISGNAGQFFGNLVTGTQALYAGIPLGYTVDPLSVLQLAGNLDGYTQLESQNINPGPQASFDYVITADDGDNSNKYITMGLTSSTWDGSATDSIGNAVGPRDGYMYVNQGNLVLGTDTAGKTVKVLSGANNSTGIVADFTSTGVEVTGNVTVSGNTITTGILTDNYYYANGSPVDFEQPAGANRQVQYNDDNNFGASPNFAFNSATNSLQVIGNIFSAFSQSNTAAVILDMNVGANLGVSGNINAVSDVRVSGLVAVTGNVSGGNIATIGKVTATGNIDGDNLSAAGNMVASGNITGANILTAGKVTATGNIDGDNLSAAGNIVASGNIVGANLSTAGKVTATGNIDGDNFSAAGNMVASGNIVGANLTTAGVVNATGNITGGNLATGGNISASGTIFATGNITGGNIDTTGNVSAANLVASANAVVGGILTDNYYYANGSPVDFEQPAGSNTQIQYNNDNNFGASSAFTFDEVANVLTISGDIDANNVTITNDLSSNTLTVTSNATIGNVSTALFVASSVANVDSLLVVTTADIGTTLAVGDDITASANIDLAGNLNITGNISQVTAQTARIFGDATTGIQALRAGVVTGFANLATSVIQASTNNNDYSQVNQQNINNGNVASADYVITANDGDDTNYYLDLGLAGSGWDGTQTNSLGNAIAPRDGYLYVNQGNLVLGTDSASKTVKILSGAPDDTGIVATFNAPGTISSTTGTGALVLTGGLGVSGNINSANLTTGNVTAGNATVSGTVAAGNLSTGGSLAVTGNISGGNLTTSGQVVAIGNVVSSSNVNGVDFNASNSIIATANITSGNLNTTGVVVASGNISGANISASGQVIATGNLVSSANINGVNLNLSGLAAIVGNVAAGNVTTAGQVDATGNVSGGNLTTAGQVVAIGNVVSSANVNAVNLNLSGLAAITGNITGGNLNTAGQVIATGNIVSSANVDGVNFNASGNAVITGNASAGNISTSGTLAATGNISGGNITTAGQVVATGNLVTSANVDGVNLNLSGLAAITGNLDAGNLNTTGEVVATGNVSGGNITTTGQVVATGNLVSSANVNGVNFNASGAAVVTGNISGGNITTGGQVIATGNLVSSANVDGVNLNLSGLAAITGNLDAGNLNTAGQVIATGNIVSSANVDGVNFNASGNAVITGNVAASGSASVTGNITGGNLITGGQVVATGNLVSSANVDAVNLNLSGLAAITGNLDAGNLITGGQVVATGNLVSSANVNGVNFNASGNIVAGNVTATTFTGNLVGNVSGTFTSPGANTNILFNDEGNIGATAALVIDKSTSTVTATGNVIAANVYANAGTIGASLLTGTLTTVAQPNVTSLGTLNQLTVSNTTANIIQLGPLKLQSVNGTTFAVYQNDGVTQANIDVGSIDVNKITQGTSIIGLDAVNGNAYITVAGSNVFLANAAGTYTTGIANATGNINGANLTTPGVVSATGNITGGNLTTGAQVVATGNITGGNINTAGAVVATGNISGANANIATNVNAGNLVSNFLKSNGLDLTIAPSAANKNILLAPTGTGNVDIGTRFITSLADPVNNQDAATKAYVDQFVQGILVKASVTVATTAALPAYSYNNGTAGVGATITALAVGVLTVDGVATALGDRILVKNETAGFIVVNGIYVVTTAGDAGAAFVLTRSSDMDTPNEVAGAFTFVQTGSTNADSGWVCTANTPVTIGTTAITWSQFSGAGAYSAGPGIALTGSQFSANIDGTTTDIVAGNISVKVGAVLVNPNITNATGTSITLTGPNGAFTGTSLTVTGNALAGNVYANSGTVGATTLIGSLATAAQPNITSVGTLASLTVTGNVAAGNVSGTLIGGTLTTAAQPNITSVGTLTSLAVTGNISGGNMYANLGTIGASLLTGTLTTAAQPNITSVGSLTSLTVVGAISGASVTGTTLTGSLTTAAQPNITQIGTLSALTVTGNASVGNISVGNLMTAPFVGGTLTTAAQPNITSVGTLTTLAVSGSATADNFTGTTLTGPLTTAAQPNITSVGTLSSLAVTANIQAGNVYANSGTIGATTLVGSLATGAQPNITSIGTLSSLAVTGTVSGSLLTGTLTTAAQPNITSVGTLGSLTVTGNIAAGNVSGTLIGGTLTTAAQPNVTSVGTLTSLNVTGNTISGNVYANSGTVGATTLIGSLATAAQPNITSIGTLGSLTVTGNIGVGNLNAGNFVGATYLQGVITGGSAAQPNITSIGTLTTLTVSGNASVGNLSTLGQVTAVGNLAGGNISTGGVIVATGNISGANLNTAGIVSAGGNVVSGANVNGVNLNTTGNIVVGGNSTIAGTETVTGNITGANINSGNLVVAAGNIRSTAGYFIGDGGFLSNLTVSGGTAIVNGTSNVSIPILNGNINFNIAGTAAGKITATSTSMGVGAGGDGTFSTAIGAGAGGTGQGSQGVAIGYNAGATGQGSAAVAIGALAGQTSQVAGSIAINASGSALNPTGAGFFVNQVRSNASNIATPVFYNSATNEFTYSTAMALAGNITAGNVYANAGTIGATTLIGSLATAAQPNVTSVGTLTSLNVTGQVTTGSVNTTVLTAGSAGTAGTITGTWSLSAGSTLQATYSDLGERYSVDVPTLPGTVMMIGGTAEVTAATWEGRKAIAGVISTDPAYVLNSTLKDSVILALVGRVPCRVVGKINKGDLLTVSHITGVATSTDSPEYGAIVGRALESYDSDTVGTIEIKVDRG